MPDLSSHFVRRWTPEPRPHIPLSSDDASHYPPPLHLPFRGRRLTAVLLPPKAPNPTLDQARKWSRPLAEPRSACRRPCLITAPRRSRPVAGSHPRTSQRPIGQPAPPGAPARPREPQAAARNAAAPGTTEWKPTGDRRRRRVNARDGRARAASGRVASARLSSSDGRRGGRPDGWPASYLGDTH